MEDNVALDSSKQKQFVKSIKGIKKLIKKNDAQGVKDKISKSKVKKGKIEKKTRDPRGLVYLGHIPHGFYENQMTQYFKQFGMVTNVRVIRSQRTGNSKGFAFVEFKEPAVAEIVAETMNNYLMGKRLIKAAYIPPEKQKRYAKRKFWSNTFNPGSEARLKMKKAYNSNKDDQGDLQKARKLLSNIRKTKNKLSALGINYDFFSPVDVPESLVNLVSAPEVKQETKKADKPVKENVKANKDKKVKEDKSKVKVESKPKEDSKRDKKKNANEKPAEKAQSTKVVAGKKAATEGKFAKAPVEVNKKEQAQKNKKLNDAGVKPVENFIKIQQESDDDSDSSYEFNSDEFEQMLSGEDGSDISEDNDSDEESEDGNDSDEESEEEEPPQLVRAPPPKVVKAAKAQKPAKVPEKKPMVPQKRVKEEKQPQAKRNAAQKPVAAKKSKFENRNTQKLAKKQFKKKK